VRGNNNDLAALKHFILTKTEGNPFFMEEIVQELREQGLLSGDTVALPSTLRLPTTVQGVLTARMDRLPAEEKALLQTLAVIGREFAASLLRKVVTQSESDLHHHLARLQAAEFVYEQPAYPEVEYIFKHALTQEVAYNSLLNERRKGIHERTAQAMEEVYRDRLDDHYSELAYHYSRSGNTQKAIDYLQLAGQQSVQRSAYTEAVNHFTSALELLKTLPDTRERARAELPLQIALGFSIISTAGHGTPEVGQTFLRARDLCQQIGETPQLFSVLRGLWNFYLIRAEYRVAREITEQFLSLAQRRQDPIFLLAAHEQMGFLSLWLAEWTSSREHHEQAISLYDPQQHGTYVSLYEADLGMWSYAQVAAVLWYQGYPEQALQKSREALRLAHELNHPFSTSWVLFAVAWLHQLRQEPQETQRLVETQIAFFRDQGFQSFLALGTTLHGWVLAMQGQEQEGIAQIGQGMAIWQSMGGEEIRSFFLALLAEAYGEQGQTESGLTVLNEALARVSQTGERFNEAELHRLKGELTLQQARQKAKGKRQKAKMTKANTEAEACFRNAIEVAQKQQAKSLELRAAMSLARLWQSQGKTTEAHELLAPVYHWFTEGFDTKDLQEAKVLIEELNHRVIESVLDARSNGPMSCGSKE
jgi:predicted ATPase